jgi:NTE family protein
MAKQTALILAGAVAKGAFEAGVLDVLSRHAEALPISRIVAASSGALNGAVYGTGIRSGAEREVAGRLVELWLHDASWHNVLKPSLMDIVQGRGVGTADRLLPLMREAAAPGPGSRRAVDVRLVLTALKGETGDIGDKRATTFEHVAKFRNDDFDTEQGRDKIFRTALGSAAFPVLFAPADVPGVGLCVDGGAVNNAPVKQAIEGGGINRIIVVTPEPMEIVAPEPLRGINLLSQIAELLINERLYRDLHDAEDVNEYLRRLDTLESNGVSRETISKVKSIFHWEPLQIVQIRPKVALDGTAFSAFSDTDQMKRYVEKGRETAETVLGALDG